MTSTTIIILLIANAIAHIVSAYQLQSKNPSMVTPVGSFVIINGLLAYLIYAGFNRARRGALLFPLVGGFGLSRTIAKEGGSTIDWVILILDILIIVGVVYLKFIV